VLLWEEGGNSSNNDNDVTDRDEDHKDDNNNANMQQPTLWSYAFQAERGWGDFDDNNYVKDNKDEPRQGQGHKSGGGWISNKTMIMTTRTRQGLGPGTCDGSVGEDELRKGHGQQLWGGGAL